MKRLLQKPTQAYLKSQCLKSGEKLRQDLLASVVPESSDEGYSYELPEEEENDEDEEYADPFKQQSAGLSEAELASAYAQAINCENGTEESSIKKSLLALRKVIDENNALSKTS